VEHHGWRAVDHEGDLLENSVTKTRDRKAALKLLKKSMQRHGRPENILTDCLRSDGAALKDLGRGDDREWGRWLNSRVKHSHVPFQRLERAMLRFSAPANIAKVRVCPCLSPQPLSDVVSPPKPRSLQTVTRRRFRRMSRPYCRLILGWDWGNGDWFAFVFEQQQSNSLCKISTAKKGVLQSSMADFCQIREVLLDCAPDQVNLPREVTLAISSTTSPRIR
jgi:hypothetical protein